MKKESAYDFLLRMAIPAVAFPAELKKEGNKTDYSNKVVWECISRAHRDVLAGRKNVRDYSSNRENGLNKVAKELYFQITENKGRISSEKLIAHFVNEKGYRIGTTQKLVNMTLKYMFLLQLFGKLEGYSIKEDDCDCPLDSRILDSIGEGDRKWTNDFKKNDNDDSYKVYSNIQNKIKDKQAAGSKLLYDFEKWQN